jgi:SNF2 family DNA or RNA helicase
MFKKLNDRINDMFEKRSFDNDFIDIQLSEKTTKKLLDYQLLHVYNLMSALKKNKAVIDGSNTGTGKTYTSLAVANELGLQPLIICPKNIMTAWKNVCEHFGITPLAVINYETARNGCYYDDNGKRNKFKYLTKTEDGYKWNFANSDKVLIIFDEVHKCKNKSSLNGKLMLSTKGVCNTMLLSATISDTPENFHVFGYMVDLYNNLKQGKNWIQGILREDKNKLGKKSASSLNKHIFPAKGSRMNIADIGDKFPKNQISAECYNSEKSAEKEIDKAYNTIKLAKSDTKDENTLTKILHARQLIEKTKVPIIFELLEKYLESGKSIAVFVNFTDTLNEIKLQLSSKDIKYAEIQGGQSEEDRESNIKLFQLNQVKVIVCMMQAGGQSISLHDVTGKYPRVSLISPSWSAVEIVQALGRCHRQGTKSPVLQRVVFCANTCEESVCKTIKEKLKFISKLTDDDLIKF